MDIRSLSRPIHILVGVHRKDAPSEVLFKLRSFPGDRIGYADIGMIKTRGEASQRLDNHDHGTDLEMDVLIGNDHAVAQWVGDSYTQQL